MKNQEKNTATAKTLFVHAYQTMQDLKKRSISVEEAKAQASLLKQSNNLLNYELQRAIAIQKFEEIQIRDIENE